MSTREAGAPTAAGLDRARPGAVGFRSRNRSRNRNGAVAALLLGPNMVLYTLFVVLPALAGVALSFFSWDLVDTPSWVGLANFQELLHDPMVGKTLLITLKFLVLGVIPTVVIGFLLAVLVNSRMRGVSVVRVIYFIPLVVSVAVSSVLWSWLFQPQSGMINRLLKVFGINGVAWLSSTTWALPALTIMVIWMSLPLVIILYLAGLQRVSDDLLEAAQLDGAGLWTRIAQIIWPAVSTTTILVFALEVLNFIAAPFEIALIMTQGGPIQSTTSISLYIYQEAFAQGRVGYASALSMLQFVVILAIAAAFRYLPRLVRRSS